MNPQTPEDLRRLLAPVFQRTRTLKALLFGSMARGSGSRRSDIDLLIVKETDQRFFARFDEYSEILDRVGDRGVDMLIYTPEEFRRISHRPFFKRILAEGKVLYERGEEPG